MTSVFGWQAPFFEEGLRMQRTKNLFIIDFILVGGADRCRRTGMVRHQMENTSKLTLTHICNTLFAKFPALSSVGRQMERKNPDIIHVFSGRGKIAHETGKGCSIHVPEVITLSTGSSASCAIPPTMLNTTNPAKMLVPQLANEMMMASRRMLLSNLL